MTMRHRSNHSIPARGARPSFLDEMAEAERRDRDQVRRVLRPDFSRGSQIPDPRTVHRDDVRAELEHGRLGRARADRRAARRATSRPMPTRVWVALVVAFWVAVIVADVLGRAS